MSTIGRQDSQDFQSGIKKGGGGGASPKKAGSRPKPGLADFIAGEAKDFVSDLQPYLPQELVGGAIPHVAGMEDEGVWNAASQACATEKVHFVYTVEGGRVWYLACPSFSLASYPDSWCPLAAALPGNSEFWDKETVYLYEHEGIASALRWDQETGRMQVFLGAARTILPRIQTMDANFVTINPQVADAVPWKNTNLKTEKLARAVARSLVFSGVLVCLASVLLLVMSYIATNVVSRDLTSVKQQTERASNDLMIKAYNAMQSDAIRHMVGIQELLDRLAKVDGTLVSYEVSSGKLEWQALIPPAFGQEFGTPKGLESDGRVRVVNNR
jgi:hypothetical protein